MPRLKKAKASWMGSRVVVFEHKTGTFSDKVLTSFKAGSRNMPENMARWATKNNVEIVNLRRDKRTGKLKVWL
jgi:hypothetical protein